MDTMMNFKDSTTAAGARAPAPQHHHHQEATGPTVEEAQNNVKQTQPNAASGGGERKPRPQLDEALRCPRCDSDNTKFCYYNNHSTLQPRYFCKACRRYWTHGGSLRNVPIGGGSRKNKRSVSKQQMAAASSSATEQGFLNMLPPFLATDFSLPAGSRPLFPPPPLSCFVQAPPPLPFDEGMPSFLDMLRAGFLDYNNQRGAFYGPTSSAMETPPLFGSGAIMLQHGVVCNHGGAATSMGGQQGATHEVGQSPAAQKAGANQQEEEDERVQDTADEAK